MLKLTNYKVTLDDGGETTSAVVHVTELARFVEHMLYIDNDGMHYDKNDKLDEYWVAENCQTKRVVIEATHEAVDFTLDEASCTKYDELRLVTLAALADKSN